MIEAERRASVAEVGVFGDGSGNGNGLARELRKEVLVDELGADAEVCKNEAGGDCKEDCEASGAEEGDD